MGHPHPSLNPHQIIPPSTEMAASSSSSPPAPPWAILGRVALAQHDSVRDPGRLSVDLAPTPRASAVAVPMSLHPRPDYDDTDRHPYVVAADGGLLLLHVSRWPFVGFDLDRDPPGVLLVARDFRAASASASAGPPGRRAVAASVVRVPDRARHDLPGISNVKSVGLVSRPGCGGGADFVVAELCTAGGGDDDRATLLSFRAGADAWVERDVSCPSMAGRRWMWSSHDVIAHDGKLWWVNLVWGLLGCDPFAADPVLRHVVYPVELTPAAAQTSSVEGRRMVRVSRGQVRLVDVACARAAAGGGRPEETVVAVWTLVFGPSGLAWWKQQCAASMASIWASGSYRATGLPREVPVLALLHPGDPDVVYFFVRQHLVGVNVAQSAVVEFVRKPCDLVEVVAGHRRPPPISWRYVLAWELPPSLADDPDSQMDDDVLPCRRM